MLLLWFSSVRAQQPVSLEKLCQPLKQEALSLGLMLLCVGLVSSTEEASVCAGRANVSQQWTLNVHVEVLLQVNDRVQVQLLSPLSVRGFVLQQMLSNLEACPVRGPGL